MPQKNKTTSAPTARAVLQPAMAYVVLATLWVIGSDALLAFWLLDTATLQSVASLKGLCFVAVTGVLLALLLTRQARRQQAVVTQALATARQSEATASLLRTVLDSTHDILYVIDETERCLMFSRAASEATGTPQDQAVGRHLRALSLPDPVSPLWRPAIGPQDRTHHFDCTLQLPDRLLDLSVICHRLDDVAFACRGLLVCAHDISPRRTAERKTAALAAQYQALFEANPQPMWVYAVNSRKILAANGSALAQFGYDREQMLSFTTDALQAPPPVAQSPDSDPRAGSGRQWHRTAWGRPVLMDLAINALPFDGEPAKVVLARDVTATAAAQSELITNRQQLSELTQRVMLQERKLRHQMAQTLHDHIGQTLALARIQMDNLISACGDRLAPEAQVQAVQLSSSLGDVLDTIRTMLTNLRPALLEEQGLAIALEHELGKQRLVQPEVDLLAEYDDALRYQRWPGDVEFVALMVAREAVANALRHARASLIRVVLSGDEHALLLQIIDDGCGMPAQADARSAEHLGIVGMRERCLAIRATFSIDAASGQGTRVRMKWPAAAP